MQGLPPAEAARYLQAIEGVAPDAAGKTAGRLVNAEAAALVIVGDAPKFTDKLRGVRSNVEVIKIDQLNLDSAALKGMR